MTLFLQTGLQAIHFAAKTANVELADELIKRGAAVNAPTVVRTVVIHWPRTISSGVSEIQVAILSKSLRIMNDHNENNCRLSFVLIFTLSILTIGVLYFLIEGQGN